MELFRLDDRGQVLKTKDEEIKISRGRLYLRFAWREEELTRCGTSRVKRLNSQEEEFFEQNH